MTKTLLIDATYPDDSPRALGEVIVTLIAGEAGGVVAGRVVLDATVVRLDEDGHGEIELATNDVEVEEPEGSFYRCTVKNSSPTITRSIRLTDDLADEVSWTDEAIQVVSPVPPTFVQLRVNGGGGTPGPTHTVALFATDVDMSGGSWTDLPVYGGGTVPRVYLTGVPVLVVDGDDFGLWTITASGPCTAGAALAPGVTIGCLAGGVGWWATAASNDGSTVAGITVAATTGQFDDVHDSVVDLETNATTVGETLDGVVGEVGALTPKVAALAKNASEAATGLALTAHAKTIGTVTAWAECGLGDIGHEAPARGHWSCPTLLPTPTTSMFIRAQVRTLSTWRSESSNYMEICSEPMDSFGVPGDGGAWDHNEFAIRAQDGALSSFYEWTADGGSIEWPTDQDPAVPAPYGPGIPPGEWVELAVAVPDFTAGILYLLGRTDHGSYVDPWDEDRWRVLCTYDLGEPFTVEDTTAVEMWIGRGGGRLDVARVRRTYDDTLVSDFDASTALDAATTVTDAVLLDEFDAPAVWTAHDNAAIHNP